MRKSNRSRNRTWDLLFNRGNLYYLNVPRTILKQLPNRGILSLDVLASNARMCWSGNCSELAKCHFSNLKFSNSIPDSVIFWHCWFTLFSLLFQFFWDPFLSASMRPVNEAKGVLKGKCWLSWKKGSRLDYRLLERVRFVNKPCEIHRGGA